jgi:hypothetical protein
MVQPRKRAAMVLPDPAALVRPGAPPTGASMRMFSSLRFCLLLLISPGHGKPGPTSPARPGPKISGLGRVFWPDGRAWAAEMRPDSLLGPGLGSRFAGFWEGPARKPDGPTEKSSFGPGLGRFF